MGWFVMTFATRGARNQCDTIRPPKDVVSIAERCGGACSAFLFGAGEVGGAIAKVLTGFTQFFSHFALFVGKVADQSFAVITRARFTAFSVLSAFLASSTASCAVACQPCCTSECDALSSARLSFLGCAVVDPFAFSA